MNKIAGMKRNDCYMQTYVATGAPFGFGNSLRMKKGGPLWVLGPNG